MELAVVLPVNIYITASHTSRVSQMKCCLDNTRRWPFRYVLFVWNKKRPFVIFVNLWSIELLPSERWSQPAIRTEMLMEGDFFNGDGFFQECFYGGRFFQRYLMEGFHVPRPDFLRFVFQSCFSRYLNKGKSSDLPYCPEIIKKFPQLFQLINLSHCAPEKE